MNRLLVVFSMFCFSHLAMAQNGGAGGNAASTGTATRDISTDYLEVGHNREFEKFLKDQTSQNALKARPSFASAFKQAQNAIMSDDLTKATPLIAKLHAMQNLNAYEMSRLHLVDYWYYGKKGDRELENEAASNLLAIGAGKVDSEAFVEAGMRLLKRQYNSQDYGGAIETLTNLRSDTNSIVELNAITSAVNKLDELSAQQSDIVQKIRTNDAGSWSTKLLKVSFLFGAVNGEIQSIVFNCTNKQTTLTYKPDSVMAIPDSWGEGCRIKVNATPNTSFNFVQLHNKPS